MPEAHDGVALMVLQAAPQPPQFEVFVPRFVSQPLVAVASQLPFGAAQAIEHAPLLQVGVPPAVLQGVAQPPQCVASVSRLVSQPLLARPSQLA